MANVSGVDETGIHTLCLDIQEYAEKIQNTLNQIQDLLEDSKNIISGDLSISLFNKSKALMGNKKTINDNILSYIDEFNSAVAKHKALHVAQSEQLASRSVSIE